MRYLRVLCSLYHLFTGAYRTSDNEQRSVGPVLWNNHGPVIPRQDGQSLQTYALSRIRTHARGLKLCGCAKIMCEILYLHGIDNHSIASGITAV